MKKKNLKALVLSMGLVLGVMMPVNTHAQSGGGMLGYGKGGQQQSLGGMLGRGDSQGGYNLYNQQFGDEDQDEDGDPSFNLYNQVFGQNVPLGNGWLVLTMAGAGYALRKRKNTKTKKS